MKKRLDVLITEKGMAETRSRASQLIKSGLVYVSGEVVKKSGALVDESSEISVPETEVNPLKYVSRAGLKLEKALKEFGINVSGLACLDIGASTGGFTDCLLKSGANKIVAVDVGENQLHKSLVENSCVESVEKTDIRNFSYKTKFDFICADLSFISLAKIFPKMKELAAKGAKAVVLIKPQFESGPGKVNKKGVLANDRHVKKVVDAVLESARNTGFKVVNVIDSPVTGKEGNKEFLVYLIID